MSAQDAIRIIDANLNRAREALRVMEEFARFSLEDAGLCSSVKQLRHALSASITDSWERARMASRDIRHDVGTAINAPDETKRADLPAVVRAACKRLTEALRAVEEYGKTIDAPFAAGMESIRYEAYELERRLVGTCDAQEQFAHARLYVIITESLCQQQWFETAGAALSAGADLLQLREKNLPDRELLRRAKRLAVLCRDHDALFILNDRPDLAALSGADGVHLGQDDVSVRNARKILPPASIVGVSVHSKKQLADAVDQTPTYVAVGPVYATDTKPIEPQAGISLLEEAGRYTALPLVAIGGIDAEKAPQVLTAADCCLCVCSAVITQPDPASATALLRSIIEESTSHGTPRLHPRRPAR